MPGNERCQPAGAVWCCSFLICMKCDRNAHHLEFSKKASNLFIYRAGLKMANVENVLSREINFFYNRIKLIMRISN